MCQNHAIHSAATGYEHFFSYHKKKIGSNIFFKMIEQSDLNLEEVNNYSCNNSYSEAEHRTNEHVLRF